jgi:hypothetical protein
MLHITDGRKVLFALLWTETNLVGMPIVPEDYRRRVEEVVSAWMAAHGWRLTYTRQELRELSAAVGEVPVETCTSIPSAVRLALDALLFDGVVDGVQVVDDRSIGAAQRLWKDVGVGARPFVIPGVGNVHRYFVQSSGEVVFSVRHSVLPYHPSHEWIQEARELWCRLETFGVRVSEPLPE